MSSGRRFEGPFRLNLQGFKIHEELQSRLTLALFMAAECFKETDRLETSAITHPTTQPHILAYTAE
jgi:hypothetical protein